MIKYQIDSMPNYFKKHLDPYQIFLDEKDFSDGNLSVNSFIKSSILFTLRNSIILYRAGKVNRNKRDRG